jgi:hypothetical protein
VVVKVHEDINYGVFLGGDPRKFSPDPECSTEEERGRHRKACESGADQGVDNCLVMQAFGYPPGPGFGLGTNVVEYACDGEGCEACQYLGPPQVRP